MEHIWNTTLHSTLGVSPFEAAHGLPARSAQSHEAAADYEAPDYVDAAGIKALQTTAKAFATHLRQVQMREASDTAELLNLKGSTPKLAVGDKVAFYIPPSAEEADLAQRKAKHLPQFRGPATITKVLTPTTFELTMGGRTYRRCLSELRKFKARGEPLVGASVAPDESSSFELGAVIAYRDTDDPDDDNSSRFHLGKVTNVADGHAHVHCLATKSKALSRAQWAPLYQDARGQMVFGGGRRRLPVIDQIPVDEPEWVWHYDVQLGSNGRISKRTRLQLQADNAQHHRYGHTF